MKCEDAVDLIVDSIMDSLDHEERAELEAHLAGCDSCAAEAEKMRGVWADLGRLSAPEPSARAAIELGRRLSSKRPRNRLQPFLRAAAAIALLLIGAAGGYYARGGPTAAVSADAGTFLFLVRADDALSAPVSGSALVQEYVDWAASLGQQGRLVGGNKLMDEPGRWVSTAATETRARSDVSGYFLIAATDYEEAIRIAGTSPHIRYGGTFEIRQIDDLSAPPSAN